LDAFPVADLQFLVLDPPHRYSVHVRAGVSDLQDQDLMAGDGLFHGSDSKNASAYPTRAERL
jgi:hypothetical protein